jgi:hypothetical protein
MPINTTHQEYKSFQSRVNQVRDCYAGTERIKEQGEVYLPKLSTQTQTEYEQYKLRGYFLPAIKPAATALTGAIMRKEAVLSDNAPDVIYGGEGRTLDELASLSCLELFVAGRGGYLIEHNGDVPSIKFYSRESITNWSKDFVILKQSYSVANDDDPYEIAHLDEYLELTIIDGVYTQRVWRQEGKSKKFSIVAVEVPTKRGEALGFIPFIFFNTFTADERSTPPVLLEMSDINLDHYRLATDERYGLHNVALPTMFLFGDIRDSDNKAVNITVGPGSANHIPNDEARAELLEFTGAGISSISATMDKDVEQMANLGAKMFQNSSDGVRAAETARIEQSGESATLSTVANSVESALTLALKISAMWQGSSEDVSVKINRDFLDTSLAAQDLTALLQTYMSGGISLDSFLYNLKKGEKLPKGQTVDDEKLAIEGGELGLV